MNQKSNEKSETQSKPQSGTERARDEKREDRGPVYGGQKDWKLADERGDQRFGHARNDDSEPLELIGRAHGPDELKGQNDDDESPAAADDELADAEANGEIESGGARAGMSRGEKPRKAKSRGKGSE